MKHLARVLLLLLLASPAFGARTFNNTSSDHLDLATAPVASAPVTISVWSVATNATDPDVLVTLGRSGVNVDRFSIEHNAGHCAINVRDAAGTNNRVSTSTSYSTATQFNCIGTSGGATLRDAWLNGGGKSHVVTSITQPVGVNVLHVSGDQANGANFLTGRLSHIAIWNVAFTDTQAAYIGAGGNPRYIPGLVAYYKLIPGASPEPDDLGGTGLTVTGTATNTGDPVVASYWTGSTVSNQSWTQNGAITSVTVDSNFSNVNSTFTTSWKLLGSPSNDTTTSGSGTASREVVVASAAAIAAGDYLRVNGGSPTQVLWVNGTTILLRDAQTWTNGNNVDEYPVNAATITGVSLSAGSLSGTPTGTLSTTSNYFFRATNSTTGTLIADSNLFSITIASAGGFTTPPHVTAVTATTATVSYTNAGSQAVHVVACKKDTTTPTRAEVFANTCTGSTTPAASGTKTSSGADTIVLTGLTLPIYDIYGADSTTRADMLDTCLSAPSGKQFINCPNGLTSIATNSPVDLLNAVISPDWAIGDILICDTATTPGSFGLTVAANGNFTYTGDASRQYANCTNYDISAAAMHAEDLDFWANNSSPTPPPTTIQFFVPLNSAMPAVDLRSLCGDADGDPLTVTGINLPTGLAIDSSVLHGTASVRGIYHTPEFTCTDITGATSGAW